MEDAALLMRLQSRERRGAVPPTSTTRLYAEPTTTTSGLPSILASLMGFLAGVRGLRSIFVIDSPSAAINFHVLDKRVVNGDNLGGDGPPTALMFPISSRLLPRRSSCAVK